MGKRLGPIFGFIERSKLHKIVEKAVRNEFVRVYSD